MQIYKIAVSAENFPVFYVLASDISEAYEKAEHIAGIHIDLIDAEIANDFAVVPF